MILTFLLLTLSSFTCNSHKTNQGTIQLLFTGIEEYKGLIQVDLYKTNEGFPDDNEYAFKSVQFKLSSKSGMFEIPHLDYSIYAIAVYHDENSDGELDTNFFGKPTEKTGASNNPDNGMIPEFHDAKLQHSSRHKSLTIEIN